MSTLRQTRSIVEHHLKPHLGHLPVNKLTTLDIDDLYRHLLRNGGHDGRPLARGTVHRVHVVLHRALTQAVRWEWGWLNPASAASPPRVPSAEMRPPSPDQVHRLLDHVEDRDPDFAAYWWLAASTGARRSQLLGVRWGEIDRRAETRAAPPGLQHLRPLRPRRRPRRRGVHRRPDHPRR